MYTIIVVILVYTSERVKYSYITLCYTYCNTNVMSTKYNRLNYNLYFYWLPIWLVTLEAVLNVTRYLRKKMKLFWIRLYLIVIFVHIQFLQNGKVHVLIFSIQWLNSARWMYTDQRTICFRLWEINNYCFIC